MQPQPPLPKSPFTLPKSMQLFAMPFTAVFYSLIVYWAMGFFGASAAIKWMTAVTVLLGMLVLFAEVLRHSQLRERASRRREELITNLVGFDDSHDSLGPKPAQDVHESSAQDGKQEQSFFNRLVGINFTYIEEYYEQTQRQANKSFLFSAIAAFFALVVVVVGVVMLYREASTRSAIITGVGVLCELISTVFFYLYNRTVLKMGEYHQKLVITQNIALALKISEGLPKSERAQAQMELIRELSRNINYHLSGIEFHESRREKQANQNSRRRRRDRPPKDNHADDGSKVA